MASRKKKSPEGVKVLHGGKTKVQTIHAPANPTDPTEQNAMESFSIEKLPIDRSPKLKKPVTDFKKAHRAFCDNLLQATYRLSRIYQSLYCFGVKNHFSHWGL